MTSAVDLALLHKSGDVSTEQALNLFDQLDPVDTQFMLGEWKGEGFNTGHRMDGLLEAFRWYGKRFHSEDAVDPLIFSRSNGRLVKLNPLWFNLKYAKATQFTGSKTAQKMFNLATYLLFTRRSRARLRMIEYRGKLSATMVYDHQPINDVFRKIDDNTVMGLMDAKNMNKPFFFILKRVVP